MWLDCIVWRDYVVAVGFVIVGGVGTFVLGWGFGFCVVHFGCWTCVFHSVGFGYMF